MRKEKLSTLCDVKNGYAFKSSDYVDSGYRVIRITNVQKGVIVDDDPKFISITLADKARNFKLELGDILISLTGNVGRVGRIQECHLPAVLNQRVGLIRPQSEELDTIFLFQYLNSGNFENEAISNSNGVAQLNLSSKWVESHQIPFPPLDDQKRIAHLLGKVEGLIARRKHHLHQLDDLLKSVFLEMFGDPIRNEKGWVKKTLAELGKLDRGVSRHRPRNAPELLGGKYPLIQTGDVSNAGIYITGFSQTYSERGFAQSKLWPTGTLCITIAANIAQTGILTFDACFPDSIVGFTTKESKASPLYVLGLFWFLQRILEKNAPAAAQKNINLKILRELEVPAPPINLQNQFVTIVEKVEGIKSRYQQSLTDLENLYGALSQKAFKGELNLSRIMLPTEGPELVEEETIDMQEKQPMEPLFELPAPEDLTRLQTAEGRKSLLGK